VIQQQAFEEEGKASEVLERGAKSLLSLMSDEGDAAMASTWAEAVMCAMREVCEEIKNPVAGFRWRFGGPKIDERAEWRQQEVNLLVGMTSHGKSLLAMQRAVNADDAGWRGLIFSAEMSKEVLAKRELAHSGNVSLYQLRRPELIRDAGAVISDLTGAAAKESTRKLVVVDRDITPNRVWSLCELVAHEGGLHFVVVDYDQLVVRAGVRMKDDEFRAQAEFMSNALAMAKRLNICFILLCQPRKVDEDVARGKRPPRVEQIFGSSAVANTAHNILWVMRKYFTSGMDPIYERSATSFILKARNDRTGKIDHGSDPDRVLFTNEDAAT
jgi:replicative DNA helicase